MIHETAFHQEPLPPLTEEENEPEAEPEAVVEPAAIEPEIEGTEPEEAEEAEEEAEEQPAEQPAEQLSLHLYTKDPIGQPARVTVYIDAEPKDRHSDGQLGLSAGRAPITPAIIVDQKLSTDFDELRDVFDAAVASRFFTDHFAED
eukprot:3478039-Prymnesium_polylepis.1